MTTAVECVNRGAALLDELDPDWWECIDLPTLDIADPGVCVLGQYAEANLGDWSWGSGLLDIGFSDKFGFSADYDYPALNEAWAEAILWREYLSEMETAA